MIRRAFHHLPGIGPERLRHIEQAGITDWDGLLSWSTHLPLGESGRLRLAEEIGRCDQAIAERDLRYLVKAFTGPDQWRILGHFLPHASFFDIETSGLDLDSYVTVVTCLHRGRIFAFVQGENLEAFLDLLEEAELLVSFNGASFDVPRVLREFHIPELPCAHLDLRWLCYHQAIRGGLKSIEQRLGVHRPPDLDGIGGEEAVWLWQMWQDRRVSAARERLLRYCAADTASLRLLAARLLREQNESMTAPDPDAPWEALQDIVLPPMGSLADPDSTPATPPADPAQEAMRVRLHRHCQAIRERG